MAGNSKRLKFKFPSEQTTIQAFLLSKKRSFNFMLRINHLTLNKYFLIQHPLKKIIPYNFIIKAKCNINLMQFGILILVDRL